MILVGRMEYLADLRVASMLECTVAPQLFILILD